MRSFISGIRARTWVILSAALAALLAVALVVWFVVVLPSRTTTEGSARSQTVAASLVTLEQTVSSTGTITPSVQETLGFEVAGTVTSVNVREGDSVEAGTVLATVDDLAATESLLAAQADLATARARLAESEEASSGSDADVATIAAADAAVDVAADAVTKAQDAMDDVKLTATVAGTVTSLDVAVGDVVGSSASGASEAGGTEATGAAATSTEDAASTGQITIVATASWTSTLSLSASDLENIAVGDQAELTIDGVEDTVFGTVTEIGLLPSTDSGAALFPVTVTTTGQVDGLFDGLSAEVDIVYERRTDVLAVPAAAVTTTDGASTVARLDDEGDEVDVEVTVGETTGAYTEILEGLAEGDEVVVAVRTPTSGGTSEDEAPTGEFPGGGQVPDGVERPEGFEPPAGSTGGQDG
jgi:macrolide-specific efflux system membrane fusion protein